MELARIRMNRGSPEDSLATTEEIQPTNEAVREYLSRHWPGYTTDDHLSAIHYGKNTWEHGAKDEYAVFLNTAPIAFVTVRSSITNTVTYDQVSQETRDKTWDTLLIYQQEGGVKQHHCESDSKEFFSDTSELHKLALEKKMSFRLEFDHTTQQWRFAFLFLAKIEDTITPGRDLFCHAVSDAIEWLKKV